MIGKYNILLPALPSQVAYFLPFENSDGLQREMPYSQMADSAILLNSGKDGGTTSEGMHS
jgi:hypothetical protein